MVRTGVTRAYGGDLRRFIGIGLRNRFAAFGTGLLVTSVLQSSTATALMTASFAERGLVAGAPALAAMLGADVGTALASQFLSAKVSWLSPLLILGGVAAFMIGGSSRRRDLGRTVIGVGLMLLALSLIIHAAEPMTHSPALQTVLAALADEPLLALAAGAALAWVAHSSLAIVLLITSLMGIGMLTPVLALTLVLGANIGGSVPPVSATLAADVSARRVTIGNLIFRTVGALVALPFVAWAAAHLAQFGIAPNRLPVDFHLAFNLTLALAFLPLIGPASVLLRRLLPERPDVADPAAPRYLDPASLENASLAIAAAARETLRMGDTVERMMADSLEVFRTDDRRLAAEISQRDDVVDRLHEAIKLYLTQVTREPLADAESRRSMEIISFTTNLEHIGDIIDKNLMELATKKTKNRLRFSEEGYADIAALHGRAQENVKLAMAVFMSGDAKMARRLLEEKVRFRDLERAAAERHLARLRGGRVESIETSSLHLDILRDLKRINSHLTSVAYPILEQAGELRTSRLRKVPANESKPAEDVRHPPEATAGRA